MSNKRPEPNPDEITIPDPGFNVILYKGECYRRTSTIGKVDTLPGYPSRGWQSCPECIAVNPTPTPSPTYTLPAPAEVGFAKNVGAHTESENSAVDIDVYRWAGFGIPFEVDYEVVSLSATYGVDYLVEPAPSGTLTFEPSDNVKYLRLILVQDVDINELDELVHIQLLEARPLEKRTRAKIRVDHDMKIIQIRESGLPPPTEIKPNDVVPVSATQYNYKFDAGPGQDATMVIYADDPNATNVVKYNITITNVSGNLVWDTLDTVGSRHVFTTFPQSTTFSIFNFAGKEIWYRITYAGPNEGFRFHVERDIPPPAYEMTLSAGDLGLIPAGREEIDMRMSHLSAGERVTLSFPGQGSTCTVVLSSTAANELIFDVNGAGNGPHTYKSVPETFDFTDCNTPAVEYKITLNYTTNFYRLRFLKQ